MKNKVVFGIAKLSREGRFGLSNSVLRPFNFMLLFFFSWACHGQQGHPEELVARLKSEIYSNPTQEYREFILDFISQNHIVEYSEAFPGAKTESLKRVRYVIPSDKTEIPQLKQLLKEAGYFDVVETIYSFESTSYKDNVEGMEMADCNNPDSYNDPGALATQHIDKMELPCAWSLTHGCPSISVGVIDGFFDYIHPDLQGKFIDIKGGCNPNLNICGHGYSSAGGIAAIVNNGICVAGAGYNTSLRGYCDNDGVTCDGCHPFPDIWPAVQDGNRIINVSCSSLAFPEESVIFMDLLLNEIVPRGITLIVSAYGSGHDAYANVPGVINVAQLNINGDFVPYFDPNVAESNVDIGVPILNMWRLQSPLAGNCGLGTANSSLAAPYVSGVAALMLCVNPCLSPAEVEQILKETSNPIPNADDPNDPWFADLNGAGALNAYQAVLGAIDAIPPSLTVQSGQTMTISNSIKSFSNITIEPTGTLVINNHSIIKMHEEGLITVKGGAKLIVDNATLTTSCQVDFWGGIRVWGNSSVAQPTVYDINNSPLTSILLNANQAGVVFLLNNSKVEKARNAISTNAVGVSYPISVSNRGGVVFAKNTEFIGNKRVAEFMQYPTPGLTFTNKSKFVECLFDGEAEGSIGVTIWDTDNITFNRCNFNGFDNEAIVTYDAGITVKDGNSFVNNWRAITNTATYPFGTYPLVIGDKKNQLTRNYFESQHKDFINSFAANRWAGLDIYNNDFFGNGIGSVGIWLDGPTQYKIDNNSFNDMSGALVAVNTGYGNDSKQNFFRCNAVQEATWGMDFWGDNLYTQAINNQFQVVNADLLLRGSSSNKGKIRSNQGSSGSPAGNCFDTPLGGDIITESNATTVGFKYWRRTGLLPFCEAPTTPGNYSVSSTEASLLNCNSLPGIIDNPTDAELNTIRQQLANLGGQLQQNPNDQLLDEQWLGAIYQKEMLLGGLIREKVAAGDYQGAEALLDQENTLESDYSLLGLMMSRGDYQGAQTLLNALPQTTQDETWFVQVQEINLQRLQNAETFELTTASEAFLDEVADSESPYRGFARSILMLLKGKRYELEHPLIERSSNKQLDEKVIMPSISKGLTVIPNPANQEARIQFGNKTTEKATITLMDVNGKTVFQSPVPNLIETVVETANLHEGVYVLWLKEDGKNDKQSRIIIQH